MHGAMSSLLHADNLWVAVAIIAGWLVLMCLRVISVRIHNAIAWHDLKVEAHLLRRRQFERLESLRAYRVRAAEERRAA
jgi:ribonuclease D